MNFAGGQIVLERAEQDLGNRGFGSAFFEICRAPT